LSDAGGLPNAFVVAGGTGGSPVVAAGCCADVGEVADEAADEGAGRAPQPGRYVGCSLMGGSPATGRSYVLGLFETGIWPDAG
jgi:hypothetical protein